MWTWEVGEGRGRVCCWRKESCIRFISLVVGLTPLYSGTWGWAGGGGLVVGNDGLRGGDEQFHN